LPFPFDRFASSFARHWIRRKVIECGIPSEARNQCNGTGEGKGKEDQIHSGIGPISYDDPRTGGKPANDQPHCEANMIDDALVTFSLLLAGVFRRGAYGIKG